MPTFKAGFAALPSPLGHSPPEVPYTARTDLLLLMMLLASWNQPELNDIRVIRAQTFARMIYVLPAHHYSFYLIFYWRTYTSNLKFAKNCEPTLWTWANHTLRTWTCVDVGSWKRALATSESSALRTSIVFLASCTHSHTYVYWFTNISYVYISILNTFVNTHA